MFRPDKATIHARVLLALILVFLLLALDFEKSSSSSKGSLSELSFGLGPILELGLIPAISLHGGVLAVTFDSDELSRESDARKPGNFSKSGRLRKFADNTVKKLDIQTDLNEREPIVEELPPSPKFSSLPVILGRVAVLIALAATLVLLVLIGIKAFNSYRYLRAKPKSEKKKEKEGLSDETLKKALKDLENDADALATSGRYKEAMHILLLDTIECFKERENTVVPITYTARELLRVLPLNSMENECFADLVRRVEPTWFGPMEGSLEDYQGARESFKRLIDSVGKP